MFKTINLKGQRFGRLVVVAQDGKIETFTAWLCKCDCGKQRRVRSALLLNGSTKSCGCLRNEATAKRATSHGHAKGGKVSRTYASWAAMLNRSTNESHPQYAYWGGRGIRVCDRWKSFENFLADMGERPLRKTLDRYPDNNGNYEPANCRWATAKEQSANRRPRRDSKLMQAIHGIQIREV
jgi:hypothetical protein